MPTRTREVRLSGGRAEIRALAVQAALDELAVELEARPEA
jgi:nicotinamide mononucleotide (NMN) deamidase PncC